MVSNICRQPKRRSRRDSNSSVADQILSYHDEVPVLSFVIPLKNEEESLEELLAGIQQHAAEFGHYEVIFIDDGSTDRSWEVVRGLSKLFPGHVRGLKFRSNRGKAAALQAGFEVARGKYIFTMDADLQDDPKEIPRFLAKIDEGYDLVSGWKEVRHDPWHKVLPSRVFNRMLSYFSRVTLHDHNCGFKCYRRDVAKNIHLFGELHRMVPALSGMQGFKVAEIVVQHHARRFGKSKYGIERFIRGFSDMLTMGFLRVYQERPSHFANTAATLFGFMGFMIAMAGVINFGSFNSLLCLIAALGFVGAAGMCVVAGLFAELMIRQRFASASSIIADTWVGSRFQPKQNSSGFSGPMEKFTQILEEAMA
jgi:glycosyltransferase involved in cell wall biosynthesis